MPANKLYDVIIVGGSYAGLAAAMALGRALKKVLIIDNGNPCNKQTPHSHNFLTNDGKSPAEIAALARLQVSRYDTVSFFNETAATGTITSAGFEIATISGEKFSGKKLIFATGIKDVFPQIDGFSACWGISVLHCPYCHGYEVRNELTGILANGEAAFDFSKLIFNWTNKIVLFTNGTSSLTKDQSSKLIQRGIEISDIEIQRFEHSNGLLQKIIFKDGTEKAINVMYAPLPFEQHCKIPIALGCSLTNEGYIETDQFHETCIPGMYAIGDAISKMRTVANAVAQGSITGMNISKKLILDAF
ncbi:MAG: NAD(P)/FAD-dependent oxidoreductase [Bacteroidetes bacterium]|nr:NAD(P)/FAD-dependent oxidoreductase [Bacteroidota bacterium]